MKIRNFVLVGLLALAFVLSPVVTNAQATPQPKLQEIYSGLNHFTDHHTSMIDQLSNQILRLLIAILDSPCGQDGAIYSHYTGQLCAGNATTTPTTTTVLSPNGADNWYVGRTYSIKYKAIGPTVQIGLRDNRYSPAFDSGEGTIVMSTANTGEYIWTVPKSLGGLSLGHLGGSNVYSVVIYSADGFDQSDAPFTIIDSTFNRNLPPSISGVSGPTVLNVGQNGTWSVQASDPENGSLSYSAVWGDEATTGSTAGSPMSPTIQQTATFTHTYSRTGTFYPTFTVTDNAGQSARTSLSVVVGSGAGSNGSPRIFGFPAINSEIKVGDVVKFNWSASDPDGDNLSWSGGFGDNTGYASQCPSPQPSTTFTASHAWSQPGTYTVNVKVSDCRGGTDTNSFQVLVQNVTTTPIPTITSSYPPNGAIMAQDGSGPGFKEVGVTFSGSLDMSHPADYFSVSSSNAASTLSISQVRWAAGSQYALSLSRPLIAGERITVHYKPSDTNICLGFLPGDVDQNGWALNADVGLLNSWLPTAALPGTGASQPDYEKDIDRNGVFNAQDVTRANELLASPGRILRLPACPSSN